MRRLSGYLLLVQGKGNMHTKAVREFRVAGIKYCHFTFVVVLTTLSLYHVNMQ